MSEQNKVQSKESNLRCLFKMDEKTALVMLKTLSITERIEAMSLCDEGSGGTLLHNFYDRLEALKLIPKSEWGKVALIQHPKLLATPLHFMSWENALKVLAKLSEDDVEKFYLMQRPHNCRNETWLHSLPGDLFLKALVLLPINKRLRVVSVENSKGQTPIQLLNEMDLAGFKKVQRYTSIKMCSTP